MMLNFHSTKENLSSENINVNCILIIQDQLRIISTQVIEFNKKKKKKNERNGEWW